MSPARVEADHYTRWPRPHTFHSHDIIRGTENRDTTRQTTLFTTSEHDERSVYLHTYNLSDRARVTLDRGNNPPPMPKPLHATLNDVPIEDFDKKSRYETLTDVSEGQVFRIWFEGDGGSEWENRDQMLGSAEVTWTPQ